MDERAQVIVDTLRKLIEEIEKGEVIAFNVNTAIGTAEGVPQGDCVSQYYTGWKAIHAAVYDKRLFLQPHKEKSYLEKSCFLTKNN